MDIVPRKTIGLRPPDSVTAMHPAAVEAIYLHYEGAGTAPTATANAEMARWRNIQAYAMDSAKEDYVDIPYSFGATQSGLALEGRGLGVRDGATYRQGGKSVSICWIGNQEQPTAAALDAIRGICAVIRDWTRKNLPVRPHSAVFETSCPGGALRAAITRGAFDPVPPPEEDNMPNLDEIRTVIREEVERALAPKILRDSRSGDMFVMDLPPLDHAENGGDLDVVRAALGARDLGDQDPLLDAIHGIEG